MQTEYLELRKKRSYLWLYKIIGKIILSRIPLIYQIWQKLGIFRHGKMDDVDYALQTFLMHIKNLKLENKIDGMTILELGPGDSASSALIASALNCRCILVDTGNFVSKDLNMYFDLREKLIDIGLNPPDLSNVSNINDIIKICDSEYHTEGIQSLKSIRTDSIDIIFSQAVIEHIRLNIFDKTISELRRILKPNGNSSHEIDLKDHLDSSLNNLRFSKNIWESDLFSKSGFYTNRLRYSDIIEIFKKNDFNVDVIRKKMWKDFPTDPSKFDRAFRDYNIDEMLVSEFNLLTHS